MARTNSNMKRRYILFWHGRYPNLIKKIELFCPKTNDDNYFWEGSLDEFERLYGDKFIVFPDKIAITNYSSFGQR